MENKKRLPQTLGAMAAMFKNAKKMTIEIVELAEELAKKEAEKTGYEAVLTREHIEKAIVLKRSENKRL
jgi:Sec-independent protein translocase protein TatA